MKQKLKKMIRNYCPDIPFLRNKLSAIKLKEFSKYIMDKPDIELGEGSWSSKISVVEKYSQQWPAFTKELNHLADEYIQKTLPIRQRNDIDELRIKMLFDCFAYGFVPDEFFVFHLEEKSPGEKQEYISNRDKDNYSYQINDIIDMDVFLDKSLTYKRFAQYYKRDAVCVEKKTDYPSFAEFVKKHPVFVKKNVMLSKGDSVELVDVRKYGETLENYFDKLILSGKQILEERVIQSAAMSKLNPTSVNTVRCMTFFSEDEIKVGPCFLKVGQGNSFVDNGGKGGIIIGIDNKSGVLNTEGFDEFLANYPEHPDTHVVFKNYHLPEWDKLIELVMEMSAKIPSVRYIGWDLAHTDAGWVVIEGNGSGQFICPQIIWERGFKKDILKLINLD